MCYPWKHKIQILWAEEKTISTRKNVRSKRLLNEIKHPVEENVISFCLDEKFFDQDQKVNKWSIVM